MEKGFLSPKRRGTGKGVKEKGMDKSGANMVNGSNGGSLNSGNLRVDPRNVTQADQITQVHYNLGGSTASVFAGEPSRKTVNFRTLNWLANNGADVVGKRIAYHVVENYVKNTWSKYELVKSMTNSTNRLFFLKFISKDRMDAMLKYGPWFIRNILLILKKWTPDANLLKEDVGNVPVWVKFHNVPITTFSEDGLSAIETKLVESTIMVDVQKLVDEGFSKCTIRVEYEWKPYRCSPCKVFDHVLDDCPKRIVSDALNNLKNLRQAVRGVQVGLKVGFRPTKQVYQPVAKKNGTNTSDSESELEKVFNKTASFMASTTLKSGSESGYGTKSLLEQWRETKVDDEYDPYDDL
ncbi:copia protein [Tanacetum coccineum]